MRWWGIVLLLLLAGCDEQKIGMDIAEDAHVELTIPVNIVEQYGTLQLEKKLPDVEKIQHQNGSITLLLNRQEVEHVEQEVTQLFTQYKQALMQHTPHQVADISYNAFYKNIYFYVADESVIYDENFLLAEELLMKHAFIYQLLHHEQPRIAILYYDAAGERVLSKKTIPIQLSVSN